MESGEISSMYFSMLAGGEYFDGFAEDLEGFQWLQISSPFRGWGDASISTSSLSDASRGNAAGERDGRLAQAIANELFAVGHAWARGVDTPGIKVGRCE
jgi:hypothetical protein